ncbi:MAG: WXG100 family type VII secretion target [Lachnospiraceae bacterium]|nr:WXG100 family type VII secretion target [Lachnospiraceae bacterium]
MGSIYFDFNAVYDCAAKVREIAANVEQEGKKITSLISTVETGWTGAGASAYINYLGSIQLNVFERSQRLYSIADALEGSAIAAEAADREAARQLAAAAAAEAAAQSASQTNQPAACPPPTPVCELNTPPQATPKEAAAAVNNMFGTAFDAINNAAKSGRKR